MPDTPVEANAALRKIAEEALPGPWRYENNSRGQFIMAKNVRHPNARVEVFADLAYLAGTNGIDEREGKFIEAFNPKTVLALLTELESLRAENERLNQALTKVHNEMLARIDAALSPDQPVVEGK